MARLSAALIPPKCRPRRRGRLLRIGHLSLLAMLLFAGGGVAQQGSVPPLPPPRPDRVAPPQNPDDKAPAEEAAKEAAKAEDAAAEAEAAACLERLTKLGVRFEKRPPVRENACRIDNPVSVSGLANAVEVSPASLMECRFAEELARWVGDVVAPRASEHFQSAPTKLVIGTSYQCRDQRSGSKLSEHAFGNGVDVMGFEFDKRAPVTVTSRTDGSPEAAFQSAVQKEACSIFTTVLGPGSDADHGDHLHLDMRKRKADYRICQ